MKLKNKVAIITGARQGMGKAIAQLFLANGASVVASDLSEPDLGNEHTSNLLCLRCDVSNEEEVRVMVAAAIDRFGKVDILVNNAGISLGGPIVEDTKEVYEKVFGVNIFGAFFCTREVLKDMYAKGTAGRVINISSIAGKNAFANSSAYSASKAAVLGFTRSLALECAPRGITVNAVCPGSVDTKMLLGVMEEISQNTGDDIETARRSLVQQVPLKRLQTAEDIAEICLFLASDSAKNINGESINVDGGMVRD